MAGAKEIKSKIGSINNTRKITSGSQQNAQSAGAGCPQSSIR